MTKYENSFKIRKLKIHADTGIFMMDQVLHVLIVDDSEDDALLIVRKLKKDGYHPIYERVDRAAAMGKALQQKSWDIILCDYKMPHFSVSEAISVLEKNKNDAPLIVVSGTFTEEVVAQCMGLGAKDYIEKSNLERLCPAIARELKAMEVRKKCLWLENELQQTIACVQEAFHSILQVMVAAVEARDPFTVGHQLRAADLAFAIASEIGLAQEKMEALKLAASLHDIGKMTAPLEVLAKPTKLTDIEFSLIKEHALNGFKILKGVDTPWPLAEIVYQHHERVNGSGYPKNLRGEEILLEARILAVSDVVESMTSNRSYRPAPGLGAALDEIRQNKGILYDAVVVDACLQLFEVRGYRFS